MKGKKGKKRASTDRRGLHGGRGLTVCPVCTKTKVECGSNISHAVVLSPFDYVALSHLACILMPPHSFVLQLPSPSRCVWCQLDKFSFFFFPFISNLCRTMSTAISPSPPPLLSRTQAITRRRRHQPPSLPRQHL